MVVLALLSVTGVAALFVALALFLAAIARELEIIGGPPTRFYRPIDYLAKIRLGVRAIERQAEGLVPQVTRLDGTLAAVRDRLRAVDANLAELAAAVARQERR
jgi:hypothetical protein